MNALPAPQNNQLQELPYNELSRLSGLRTLNLHNNLISSEGERDSRRQPLPGVVPAALSLTPLHRVCGRLCGSSQNCPLLSRMETRDGGWLWLLWTGSGGAWRSLCQSLARIPGVARSTDSPCSLPDTRLGVPHCLPCSQDSLTKPSSPSPSCSTSTWPTTR